jgi:hypothetical protein
MFSFIFVTQVLLLTLGIQTGEVIGYIPKLTPSQTAPSNEDQKPQIHSNKTDGKQDTSIPTAKPLPPFPLALQPSQPSNLKKKAAINVSIKWDGWPDGHFEQDFTFKKYNRTGRLKVYWAHKIGGGD